MCCVSLVFEGFLFKQLALDTYFVDAVRVQLARLGQGHYLGQPVPKLGPAILRSSLLAARAACCKPFQLLLDWFRGSADARLRCRWV